MSATDYPVDHQWQRLEEKNSKQNLRSIRLISIRHCSNNASPPETPNKEPFPALILIFLAGLDPKKPTAWRIIGAFVVSAAGCTGS